MMIWNKPFKSGFWIGFSWGLTTGIVLSWIIG